MQQLHPGGRLRHRRHADDWPTAQEADMLRRHRQADLRGFSIAGTVIALFLMGCHMMGVGLQ